MAEWTRIYQCLPNVKSITWDAGPDLPMIFTSNGKHTADKIHLVTQVLFNSFSSRCTLHLHPFSNTCVRAFKLHNRFFFNSASDSSSLDSTNLLFKTGHSFLLMKLVQQVNTHTFNIGRCTLLMKLVQHINTHTFKTGYSTLLMKLVPQINTHTHTHSDTHLHVSIRVNDCITNYHESKCLVVRTLLASLLTFPALTASRARETQWVTLAEMQRYLKNRWWADQNCPHMDLRMRCSALIRSAAFWNMARASIHWKHKRTHRLAYSCRVNNNNAITQITQVEGESSKNPETKWGWEVGGVEVQRQNCHSQASIPLKFQWTTLLVKATTPHPPFPQDCTISQGPASL